MGNLETAVMAYSRLLKLCTTPVYLKTFNIYMQTIIYLVSA